MVICLSVLVSYCVFHLRVQNLLLMYPPCRARAAITVNGTDVDYSLPANNLGVTTVDSFWAAVEATNLANSNLSTPYRVVNTLINGRKTKEYVDIVGCAADWKRSTSPVVNSFNLQFSC